MDIDYNLVLLVVTPALIVGLLGFFAIQSMVKKETLKQKYQLLKANQKETLPLRLQAYERLTLLLDRISLDKLVVRVVPIGDDLKEYKQLLIANINQEFEHNLTQQMYVSDDCWNTILKTKQAVLAQILQNHEGVVSASRLREFVLTENNTETPSNVAQSFIRNEVSDLLS